MYPPDHNSTQQIASMQEQLDALNLELQQVKSKDSEESRQRENLKRMSNALVLKKTNENYEQGQTIKKLEEQLRNINENVIP